MKTNRIDAVVNIFYGLGIAALLLSGPVGWVFLFLMLVKGA